MSSRRFSRQPVDELLDAVHELVGEELPLYTDVVRTACSDIEPVFQRPEYEQLFLHCAGTVPGWLARIVFANADVESDGSQKLVSLWGGVPNGSEVEANVWEHAADEGAHARLFVKLGRLAFPSLISSALAQAKMRSLAVMRDNLAKTEFISDDVLFDHLVQMNIGEIRTRVHVGMFAPVIAAFAPADGQDDVEAILARLLDDEVRHIGYTAQLVERWARDGNEDRLRQLFLRRLANFDQITVDETKPVRDQYAAGLFPNLLEI